MRTSQIALLVGGTDEHLDRAKALGLTVVLIQHPDYINPHQIGHADALLMVDYTDWDKVWPLAEAAHKVWGFGAVLSLTEGGLETAARLNERFGFKGNSYEVVRRIRDKAWMRRELAARGGRLSTDFGLVTDRESLVGFGARVGYPFIVKPTDTAASFGLLKVAAPADIDRVWTRIEQLTGTRTDRGLKLFVIREFLMEAYVDGPEFSVEACSFAGRHAIVTVTEKLQDETNFVELGHALPARLDPETYDGIVEATVEFLDLMGVTDGPTHTEFRLGPQGPVVIESHTRNGGGGLTDLVIGAYGIDLVDYGVGWPLGLVEELPDRPRPIAAACTRFVRPEPGTVTAITGVAELAARPDVLDVNVSVAVGDTVRPLRDNWDRVAYLAVRAADTDAAVALCERLVAEAIRIEVRAESEHVVSFAGHDGDVDAFEAEYRNVLDKYGFVHAVDLPDSFDHADFLARFGAFYPGPSGRLIDDIVPETGMDDVYYGSNKMSLLPHTEGYEFEGLPPRYLALWCVTPPTGPGGETTLFDARSVTERLSTEERGHLEERRFDWVASEGLRRIGLGQRATHPMLETVDGVPLLRFSCNNLVLDEPDETVTALRERVTREWDGGHHRISYARNDLVQFDNWRVLHSRNAFSDPKRHLKRIQIRHLTDLRSCPAPAQG